MITILARKWPNSRRFFADKLFIIHLSVSGLSGGYLPHYFTVQYNIHR